MGGRTTTTTSACAAFGATSRKALTSPALTRKPALSQPFFIPGRRFGANTSHAMTTPASRVGPPRVIQIDAQLVRVIEVAGVDRMRMQLEAPEVHDPHQARGVVDDHLLGGASWCRARTREAAPAARPGMVHANRPPP